MSFSENQIERILDQLTGQTIESVQLWNIHSEFYHFQPNTFVIDGGVEIKTTSSVFTIVWNREEELFEPYFSPIKDFFPDDLNVFQVDERAVTLQEEFIGKTIQSVQPRWNFYQKFDDDFVTLEEKYYLLEELVLDCGEEHVLQIATIAFRLTENGIGDAQFDCTATLLVTGTFVDGIQE